MQWPSKDPSDYQNRRGAPRSQIVWRLAWGFLSVAVVFALLAIINVMAETAEAETNVEAGRAAVRYWTCSAVAAGLWVVALIWSAVERNRDER